MSTAAFSMQELRAEMQKTNALFSLEAFGKRNFAAFDQIYTEDAHILPPGAPIISGRAAIKDFWANMITSTNAKSATLETLDVIRAGDDAVEIGRAILTIAPEGQAEAQLEAKYVVHWKREDSRWKWNIDIWNTNA